MSECVTTVLFADLSGSVPLYESLGDAAAKAIVVSLQRLHSSLVAEHSGFVQEIIGDEIMCRFEKAEHALECAERIHLSTIEFCSSDDISLSNALEMRIGIHCGPAIMENDRLFGDTINTAARVMSIAQAGQTITTSAVLEQLPPTMRALAREFDKVVLKGKSEPTTVFDIPWQVQDLTQIKRSDIASHLTKIQLSCNDISLSVSVTDCPVYVGRAINNLLVVDSDPVSRRHVAIAYLRGRFVLSDQSTNGTYVCPNKSETIYLRREQIPLWGTGRFCLGAPEEEELGHVVEYHCS